MKDYKNVNENIRLKIKAIRELRHQDKRRAKKMEDDLIVSLAYLVHSVVFKYKKFNNYEDLYQEGMIGLIKAVQQYDANTSFHFTRYAMWWIKARVMRSIKKMNLITISGDDDMKYCLQCDIKEYDVIDYENPEVQFVMSEKIDMINIILETLPEKHQQVIKMRYGLNNTKEHNLQELSDKLNMTREGIRQLEHRILNKLKTYDIISE